MLNAKSLKNINKKEFYPFLRSLDFKNVKTLLSGRIDNDYSNVVNFLKDELSKPGPLSGENLDAFLSYKYFYEMNNFHVVYNLASFGGIKGDVELSTIDPILKNPDLKLNYNLSQVIHNKSFELCSTRIDTFDKNGSSFLSKIQFLVFIEEVNTLRGIINLYCCVDIDLVSKFVSFKFNSNVHDNRENNHEIINKLIRFIENDEGLFKDLKIVTNSHNQFIVRKTIQKLFIDLSRQAELLLKKEADKEIQKKAENFLESINVPKNDDYIKQIISVVYQNISRKFTLDLFNDGWVFRFVFKEGDNTRASSSTDDFKPVYGKQVYWNLKELMFKNKGTDFIEAGFLWLTNNGLDPVSVKIEQKNNLLLIQYYKRESNETKRKEKEEFVLRKIKSAFPK
jgi:hypothetical protein